MSITLPPLPEPVYTCDEDGNKVFYEKASLVRARDREVARLVLKAAADLVDDNAAYCSGQTAAILGANADAIRKMEVRHHE
jgi:hypothetical protein